jgi:hypothetical protein
MKVGDLMKTSVIPVDEGGGAVVAVSKTDARMLRGNGRDVSVPFL